MPVIAHLIDDTTPGGVMRVIDHMQSEAGIGALATHRIISVPKSGRGPLRVEADVIVSHLALNWRRLPWLMQLRAVHTKVQMIHVEHSYTAGFARQNVKHPARFATMLRVAFSLFDRLVAVSTAQAAWIADNTLADPSQVSVIPSAVDVAPFLALPTVKGPLRVIGAFGRLEPQKGFDRLIRAMRATPRQDLELHIFGEGSERGALAALAGGDPRIVFKGFCSSPAKAMASVDVVAMPSRWEAYGLVALEARAAGRALLVSPIDGLMDHVKAGAIAVHDSHQSWCDVLTALGTPNHVSVARARRDAAQATTRFAASWSFLLDELRMHTPPSQAA